MGTPARHDTTQPCYLLPASSCSPSPPRNAANRTWFRFPSMRRVFCRSRSLISCQFEIRDTVPSRPITIGPRWSSTTALPSTSSVVVPSELLVLPSWLGAGSAGNEPPPPPLSLSPPEAGPWLFWALLFSMLLVWLLPLLLLPGSRSSSPRGRPDGCG